MNCAGNAGVGVGDGLGVGLGDGLGDGPGDGVGAGVGDKVGPFGGTKFEVIVDRDPPHPARMQTESRDKTARNFAAVMGAPNKW